MVSRLILLSQSTWWLGCVAKSHRTCAFAVVAAVLHGNKSGVLTLKFEGNALCHRLSETGKSVIIGLSVVGFQM